MATNVVWIGLDKVERRLADLKRNLDNPTTFLQQGAIVVLQDQLNNIAQGGPQGAPEWPPMDADTVKRWGTHQLLNRTGKLVRSIQSRFGTGFFDVYTSLWYGKFHQMGKGNPKRVFIKLSDKARALQTVIAQRIFGWK